MNKENITVIVADFMYFALIGSVDIINKIIEIMNMNQENKHYISIHTETPIARILDSDIIKKILIDDCYRDDSGLSQTELAERMKYCMFAEGMETAQCLIYADGYRKDHMLIEVTDEGSHFKISFPVIQLDDEVSPDKLIGDWIMKRRIQSIVSDITIRPVSIVGNKNDILVFVSMINREAVEKKKICGRTGECDENIDYTNNNNESQSIDSLDSI